MSLINSPLVNTNVIDTIIEFKLKYDDINNFIFNNKLSEVVLEYYIKNYKVDWYTISKFQVLSESFIDKYNDKLKWWIISANQTLSESFITKYSDKVYWLGISTNQTLSEQFIIRYIDKVHWYYISAYQTLTESFITKYSDKVDWLGLFDNKKITLRYEFILKYLYEFNLYSVCIGIKNNDNVNINRLIKEFSDKYRLDKLAYEFNNNN